MSAYRLFIALIAGCSVHATASPPGPPKGLPIEDESFADASFLDFKRKLEQLVRSKNAEAVRAIAAPGIKTGFGPGDEGPDSLALDPAAETWLVLTRVLALGCARQGEDSFICPAHFARAPNDIDWLSHRILAGRATLLADPDDAAVPITTRDTEIVAVLKDRGGWTQIRTRDGKEGWVRADALYSPLGPRVGFERDHGAWRMTFLVSGGD